MAIRSGAAATEAGATETSAGGGGGADSAPSPVSSWTIVGGREVALGGLPQKEFPPGGDAAGRMGTLTAFLLLKTSPPSKSSSSEIISNTLFPLSRGLERVMKPRPVGRQQWAGESRMCEVVGGYVRMVKMSLVGLQ